LAYNPASQIASETRSNDAYAYTAFADANVNTTTNGLNQVIASGTTSVSWDANGNMATYGTSTATHNIENKLTSAVTVGTTRTLSYDPLNRLDTYNPGTTSRFIYDGNEVAAELDGSGNIVTRFVRGDGADELIASYAGSGTISRSWVHADERGSIVALSDGTGAATAIYKYDEYGIPMSGQTGRFQYTGQMRLNEVGVYNYKARNLLAEGPTFLEPDPIGYAASANPYDPTGGDPVNNVDPTGLCPNGGVGSVVDYKGSIVVTCPWITGDVAALLFGGREDTSSGRGSSSLNLRDNANGGDQLPCAAANQTGQGVLIKLNYTNANSSLGIPVPGASHTFITATDTATGQTFASRAGPGSGPGGGAGLDVSAMALKYDPSFPDYSGVKAVQTVGYLNVPFNDVKRYMMDFASATNGNHLLYEGYTQNSNSYAAALLMGMGFRAPPPIKNVPGYGSNIPQPNLQCKL
jgi:RHS repeat-associated protein